MVYLYIPDEHLAAPESREFVQNFSRMVVSDRPTDGIICPAHPSFCLEFDVCAETVLRTADEAMVAELIFHLSKENAPRVHVRLGQGTGSESVCGGKGSGVPPTIAPAFLIFRPYSTSSRQLFLPSSWLPNFLGTDCAVSGYRRRGCDTWEPCRSSSIWAGDETSARIYSTLGCLQGDPSSR